MRMALPHELIAVKGHTNAMLAGSRGLLLPEGRWSGGTVEVQKRSDGEEACMHEPLRHRPVCPSVRPSVRPSKHRVSSFPVRRLLFVPLFAAPRGVTAPGLPAPGVGPHGAAACGQHPSGAPSRMRGHSLPEQLCGSPSARRTGASRRRDAGTLRRGACGREPAALFLSAFFQNLGKTGKPHLRTRTC